jgi:hypothetical protein
MKLWIKRVGPALYPWSADFQEEFEKLPRGVSLRADITQPRNLEFHRLYWALCTRVGSGIGKDAEWVDWALKVETGHCDVFMTRAGREVLRVRSIAFDKMDEIRFRQYFEEVVIALYDLWKIPPDSVADLLLPRGMAQIEARH